MKNSIVHNPDADIEDVLRYFADIYGHRGHIEDGEVIVKIQVKWSHPCNRWLARVKTLPLDDCDWIKGKPYIPNRPDRPYS